MANGRMKDFFDMYQLSMHFKFEGNTLRRAIQSTFRRRKTDIPEVLPLAFTKAFSADPSKRMQWVAFFKRTGISQKLDFESVVRQVGSFVLPVFHAIRNKDRMDKWSWIPEQGWAFK
jgi:hypothetical protein